MKLVRHTIRLPESLDKSLRVLAERHGINVYALLPRAVKAGVAALASPPTPNTLPREIVAELASVSTCVVEIERTLDRALFTAYCYARSAATGARKSDEIITAEINAAYDRQRRLSQEGRT